MISSVPLLTIFAGVWYELSNSVTTFPIAGFDLGIKWRNSFGVSSQQSTKTFSPLGIFFFIKSKICI